MRTRINLLGQKFGKLLVINKAEDYISPNGKVISRWLCLCDCGNKCIKKTQALRRGTTRSCGCLQKEERKKTYFKVTPNKYEVNENYVIGYTNKNEKFYFDLEDFDKVKERTWYINKYGYPMASKTAIFEPTLMHRLIMGANKNEYVDHINHNKYDNRKSNLRIVSRSQNSMNIGRRKNNTSGVTGVYLQKNGKWIARITANNKNIYLGIFENKEEAIISRHKAEDLYYGEYKYKENIGGKE